MYIFSWVAREAGINSFVYFLKNVLRSRLDQMTFRSSFLPSWYFDYIFSDILHQQLTFTTETLCFRLST